MYSCLPGRLVIRPRSSVKSLLLAGMLGACLAAAADANPAAAALRAQEPLLAASARSSAFGAPLLISSTEVNRAASGSVHARVAQDFTRLAAALKQAQPWCEVLILHLNIKRCESGEDMLAIHIGSKREQALSQAYRLVLRHSVEASEADYLRIRMDAPDGPLGVRQTTLVFEATAAGAGASIIRFEYAIGYGALAHLAMHGYLATLARDKIGFTEVQAPGSAASAPVGGARGVVERNAMRYYLAIQAYLDSLAEPPATRVETRLAAWFDATERYRAQLHEIERSEYLAMKRHEMAEPAR